MKYLLISWLLAFSALAQENRIKIAVIDTGLIKGELLPYLCKEGHKSFVGTDPFIDSEGHGTFIVDIISQYINPSKQCLLIINYFHSEFSREDNGITLTKSINYAIEQNVKYINISSSGPDPIDAERKAIETALKQHIRVVVSAGNNGTDLSKHCISYPSCYPIRDYNFFIVGALNNLGSRISTSNYNGPVNQYEKGLTVCAENIKNLDYKTCRTGTSVSTAVFTGKLVNKENR